MAPWLKYLAVWMLAGGGVVYVLRVAPLASDNPVRVYWEHINAQTLQAYQTLQRAIPLNPGDGMPAVLHPFTEGKGCAGQVRRVELDGIHQIDAAKVALEAPLLEGKPFEMGEALRLLRHVKGAYQRAGLPDTVVSLHLAGLCQGVLRVRITEDVRRAPDMPEALMNDLLTDVEAMLRQQPPARRNALPSHPQPTSWQVATQQPQYRGPASLPDTLPLTDETLGYQPVAPLQPPQVLSTSDAPAADWGDTQADTTATPWQGGTAAPGDDNLLLLSAMINGRLALDGFEAYLDTLPGQAWVPLSLIVKALDFPITVDAGAGRISGWFIREDNQLQVDMAARRVTLAGKTLDYPHDDIRRQADDIYVRNRVLGQWFPLSATLDVRELRLLLVSTEELPVDARLAREAAWADMEAQRALEASRMVSDAQNIPYSLLGMPLLRLNGALNTSMPASDKATTTGNFSLQAEGDALYTTGNLNLSGQRDATGRLTLNDANLKLVRQELTPSLLGPLHATSLEAGDITAARATLTRGETMGRGVRVSNRPFQRVDDPDRFVLEGVAPVGWDVEVYQNQSLLAFQRVAGDGRYRFQALPLKVGLNLFQVVQHGPQGQKKESWERFVLGADMPNPGEVQYDASLFQPRAKTIDTLGKNDTSQPFQASARLDMGLTKALGATLGVYGVGQHGGRETAEQGLTAGLRGSVAGAYLTADTLQADGGGASYAVSARGNLGNTSDVRLRHIVNSGFAASDEPVKHKTELELGTVATLGSVGLNASMGGARTVQHDGTSLYETNQRTSLSYQRWSLTNSLTREWDDAAAINSRGELELAGTAQGASWRGSVQYSPETGKLFQRATAGGQVTLTPKLGVDGTVSYIPGTTPYTEANAAVRYDFGAYALGLQSRADTLGNTSVGVNFSTLLVPQQGLGYRQEHPSYGTGLGRAMVKVFVDDNGNGTHDTTERLLANVLVRNRSRGTQHRTDAQGVAVVDNLLAYQPVKLSLDEETLPDIFLKAARENVVVVSHPGANGTVDLPLRLYGEVVGSLFNPAPDGTVRAVSGLMVQLVNAAGEVVDYAISESDGYFAMAPVPLGTYSLRLREGESTVSGYRMVSAPTVTLTKDANTVEGVDIELAAGALPDEPAGMPASTGQGGVRVVE